MFQVDIIPYASDALEDAMRLAQTKALNSYTFSDCMSYLNYAWSDIYKRIAMIDSGYYSKPVRITSKLTHLPPYVQNCVKVFSARQLTDFNRQVYRPARNTDMCSSGSYTISGMDLYVPDAEVKTVWLEYVPQPEQIFFTHHNRDPKIYPNAYVRHAEGEEPNVTYTYELKSKPVYEDIFNLYKLVGYDEKNVIINIKECTREQLADIATFKLISRINPEYAEDVTDYIKRDCDEGEWIIRYICCKYPYIFISYEHSITGEHYSGFLDKELNWIEFNPFAYTGQNSNVEYVKTSWNDKTGMGVCVQDYNDIIDDEDNNSNGMPRVKELGWTPDTKLIYPDPVVYRYLVARLADKFAALNESSVTAVQKELIEAEYAFDAFLNKNKGGFTRITNVNPVTVGDLL